MYGVNYKGMAVETLDMAEIANPNTTNLSETNGYCACDDPRAEPMYDGSTGLMQCGRCGGEL